MRRSVVGTICLAVLGVWWGPALAHGGFDDQKLLKTGVLHVLYSPLSLAALVGLVVSTSGVKDFWAIVVGTLAGAAAAVATLLTGATAYWLPHAVIVWLGLSAVSGVQPKLPLAVIYAVCSGFAAGVSAELENVSIPVLTGAAVTVGFAALACITGLNDLLKVNRFKAVTLLARRVIGSWVAAIALLLGALAVRMHNG